MHSLSNKKLQMALIGCGYWGTIIANNLLNLGYKNFYIYDSNLKNSLWEASPAIGFNLSFKKFMSFPFPKTCSFDFSTVC